MTIRALAEPNAREYESAPDIALPRSVVRRHNLRVQQMVKRLGAERLVQGYFRCPWPVSLASYERIRKAALDRWIAYMEKDGWTLVGKPAVRTDKKRPSHRLQGDWYSVVVPNEVEIPVVAMFKKNNMQIVRVEVPVSD